MSTKTPAKQGKGGGGARSITGRSLPSDIIYEEDPALWVFRVARRYQ